MKARSFVVVCVVNVVVVWLCGVVSVSALSHLHGQAVRRSANLDGTIYPFVDKVHVVYMTHLDVGFTNFARNVCELYFNSHFPAAIQTALELKQRGGPERFVYTSHPWLLLEYFDGAASCTPQVRNSSQLSLLHDAIVGGDVSWHAHSFSMFTPMLGPDLFNFSLTLAHQLDDMFNLSHKIAASQKDTMGHSISSVPLFAQNGIKALHIGANFFCKAPETPPAFIWKHQQTNTELLVFMYNKPSGATPCTSSFCVYGGDVVIPGFTEALVYDFTIENAAPRTADEVIALWAAIRRRYPNAQIVASSLDNFAQSVLEHRDSLPVITDEIGDTWIYGTAADPYKVSMFRAISRNIEQLSPAQRLDPSLYAYNRRLLKVPEHNWGLSTSGYLSPTDYSGNWDNLSFRKLRNQSDFATLAAAWVEGRSFLEPVAGSSELVKLIYQEAQQQTRVVVPDVQSLLPIIIPNQRNNSLFIMLTPSSLEVGVSYEIGCVMSVVDVVSGREWANTTQPLAWYTYQTYSTDDYLQFNYAYNPACGLDGCADFAKPGMTPLQSQSQTRNATVAKMWRSADNSSLVVLLANEVDAVLNYGAPPTVWITYNFPSHTLDSSSSSVNSTFATSSHSNSPSSSWRRRRRSLLSPRMMSVELVWSSKPATRLPEASWLSFSPASLPRQSQSDECYWSMDVQAQRVSPTHIVDDGSRRLHSVWGDVRFYHEQNNRLPVDDKQEETESQSESGVTSFSVRSWDAQLMSVGDRQHLLSFDNSLPDCNGGVHFNLHNNLWGTAFPQWYDDAASFRFDVTFDAALE